MGLSGLVLGLDGGNSKTDLAVAGLDGSPQAYVRGPGTNSHGMGAQGVAAIVQRLVSAAAGTVDFEAAALFCCGADLPDDIDALRGAFTPWLRAGALLVDNDTFALLHAGRRQPDAVAVVCGAGINCVGESAHAGTVVRYPGLGWESGDWGGSEMLGREAVYLASRARDGRGEPSVLPEVIEAHFGAPLADIGTALHYRRLPIASLGSLGPRIVAAAEHDSVAGALVSRLAGEVVLMAWRALRDLGALERPADVVLGGGMMVAGQLLERRVVTELSKRAPLASAFVCTVPPVVGALTRALELAGAPASEHEHVRSGFAALGAPVAVA